MKGFVIKISASGQKVWDFNHARRPDHDRSKCSQAVSQPEMALNRVTLPSSVEGGGRYRWNRADLGLPNLLTPHAHIATSCSYIIGEYTPFLKPHTFSLCFC